MQLILNFNVLTHLCNFFNDQLLYFFKVIPVIYIVVFVKRNPTLVHETNTISSILHRMLLKINFSKNYFLIDLHIQFVNPSLDYVFGAYGVSMYRNALPPNALHFKPEFWILMLHLTHFFFQIRCD
ncbi:hypothetical protein BpHYR1_018342 [Brachionus plicatilis]|uniref:Uncharacterized protein n=1 Tax=Brachionus plicatilis TaxID=10195 RepID=A0A3M7RA54_BRAPC|nr:hypothetical protein BpHYR1_018342 [Brachionus plicatilis]